MNRLMAVLVILSGLVFAQTAHADDQFACFAYTSVVSRALFNNTGTYASTGPALINVTECAHSSGVYGQEFLLIPFEKFDVGKELDVRFGYRPKIPELDVDASVVWYGFTVGNTGFQTLDVRLRLAHTFPISTMAKLELYGVMDYQHSLTLGNDSLTVAPGVSLDLDLPLPGTPNLRLGAEMWKWVVITTPGNGPIGSFTADLGFTIPNTKLVVGPRAHITLGGVDEAHSSMVRKSFGVFVSAPFGF